MAELNRDNLIKRLFEAMRCEIGVIAEHGDNEASILQELETATPDILEACTELYLD